jgi:hypothetical protein
VQAQSVGCRNEGASNTILHGIGFNIEAVAEVTGRYHLSASSWQGWPGSLRPYAEMYEGLTIEGPRLSASSDDD